MLIEGNKFKKATFCALATSVTLLLGTWTIQAQDTDLHPQVVRSQDNGWVYYQRIVLKNFSFQFLENQKALVCASDLIDFDLIKNQNNKLARAEVTILADPDRGYQWEKGRPSGRPLSNSTSYWDLDGDTVFDAMVKHSWEEKDRGSYILYQNRWLQVGDSKLGFTVGQPKTSDDGKTTYIFNKSEWEMVKE